MPRAIIFSVTWACNVLNMRKPSCNQNKLISTHYSNCEHHSLQLFCNFKGGHEATMVWPLQHSHQVTVHCRGAKGRNPLATYLQCIIFYSSRKIKFLLAQYLHEYVPLMLNKILHYSLLLNANQEFHLF